MSRSRLGLCGAAALLVNVGCAALGPRPEIRDVRPRIAGIDLQGVDLAFDVDVHNPYPVVLRTPHFQYGLDVGGAPFIDSGADVEIELPAGKVGTATLPVRVEYAALWNLLSRLAGSAQVDYRLHGTFFLSALGQSFELPLAHEGTFPILHLPRFSVRGVDVPEVSLSRARVAVEVELDNPNVFDIDARALGYALQIGEVEVGDLTASTLGTIAAGESGLLTLSGEITAKRALVQLVRGESLGKPRLTPSGAIETPYGSVNLPR